MSILDLPNELVFGIIHYLGFKGPSSLHVALTCRRLYDIVMPYILKAQENHIDDMIHRLGYLSIDSSFRTTEPHSWNTPPELARTVTQSPKASLTKLAYRIRNAATDMRCVHRLIHSSKSLEMVELNLDYFTFPSTLSHAQQTREVRNLANYIASIASRPGLSLTVRGELDILVEHEGGPFIFEIRPHETSWPPTGQLSARRGWQTARGSILASAIPATFWRYIFSGSGPPITPFMRATPRSPTIPPTVVPLPRLPKYDITQRSSRPTALKRITIHTSTLFRASFYPLTIQLLNNAPITTVELQGVGLGHFDCSKILPAITLPSLTNLAIGDLNVASQDLLDFLNRHPLISVLSFVRNRLFGVFQAPTLPHLNTLAGNAEYIVPFLDDIHNFEELAQINLVTNGPFVLNRGSTPVIPEDQCYPVFDRLSRLPASKFNIMVYSLEDSGIFRWVRSKVVGTRTLPTVKELVIMKNELKDVITAIVGSDHGIPPSEQEQRELVQRFVWKALPRLEVLRLRDLEIFREDLRSLRSKPSQNGPNNRKHSRWYLPASPKELTADVACERV